MAFTSRTTAPDGSEQWWKTSFSPCITGSSSESKSLGCTIPNCVGYAFGRFAEILGKYPEGLPSGNAGTWYDSDTTHAKSNDPYAPKLGAVVVWTKAGAAGHVAIVEGIDTDANGNVTSITTSESGWGKTWSNRFWTSTRYPPNYSTGAYVFKGFIYNPAVTSTDTVSSDAGGAELSLDSPNHPARLFIAEAEKHVGADGHAWVQSMVPIGSQPWCAATVCAVAKACGYNDIIIPSAEFTASGCGKAIVETYGGEYFAGPMMGGSFTPQVGDIIEYTNSGSSGTFGAGTKYSSYHVGMVRYCEGDVVYTVEGNTSGTYNYREKDRNGANIGWYARPDWTKVGGSATTGNGSALFKGGPLYTTKSTNADAAVREVCYLSDDGKPSISLTTIKLSVVNYTGVLAAFVELLGGSSSSSTSTSGSPDNIDALTSVQREIVEFLTSKGLCTAAGIGVIANIQEESGFNTASVGDHGTSFGICQWHNDRGTAMKSAVGTDWSNNLTGQLNYLWSELNSSYYNSVLVPLQSVSNTLEGAESAAETWCRKYEVPDKVDDQVKIRKANAKTFWEKVVVVTTTDTGTTATNATAQGKISNQSGQQITQGSSTSIPNTVSQTGIIANYTSYDRSWARNTTQRTLYDIWVADGKPSSHGIATLKGYYLIALAPKFGTTGDIVSVVLSDGTYFNAILGDAKGADAKSEWGHYFGDKVDIVEWESVTSQNSLRSGLEEAGWLNKKVDRIVNYGSWLSGSRT